MSLRRKTSIVISVSLVLLTLVMYFSLRQVLLKNLVTQENDNVREDMVRVINAFDNENRELQGLASDWAQWDDAYNFVRDGNQAFIDSNMVDSTFTNLKVNLMVFVDQSGRIVFSKSFDFTNQIVSSVPKGLSNELQTHSLLIHENQSHEPITGLLMLPDTPPLLISSFPIKHSDGTGNIAGTLLFGRYIDSEYTKRMSEITNVDVEFQNVKSIDEYLDYKAAYLALDQSHPIVVKPQDDFAVGYAILKDLNGNPALISKIQVPRDFYKHGMSILFYSGLFLIIEGLLIGLLILYLLEPLVLSRLFRLSREIKLIGKTGFGARVTKNSEDELGQLAGAINNMLVDLEATNVEIANILENISDSFVSYDENLRYTYINKAAEQMLGFNRNDLIGQKAAEYLPQLHSVLLDKYRQVLEEKTPQHFEIYFDLLHKWLELNIYPKDKGISIYFRDISERKLKEDMALRQSEELFFQAFHRNPIMMAILSIEEEKFIDANEVLLITLGYTREELINSKISDMHIFQTPDKIKKFGLVLLERGKLENIEITFFPKRGEARSGLLWSYLFYIESKPCHLAAIIDITEQRRMQKEFEKLDRLNLVGQIAASIAHEIRNPMTTVRGLLQMLSEQEEYLKNHSYFNLMIEELDRANTIISEFLSIAQNKAVDLNSKSLDSIIKALYPLIQADANYSGTQVKLELGDPPNLLLDEGEIRQMILNLARNGLDAMASGGILTIGTLIDNSEIVLFIKDEGSGLDPNLMDKLGTPFLTTKENGTGLGLAICYSIATHHNARIEVETGFQGTTFRIHFPRRENN